jgi:Cu-Zn family superoxide dismutase
VIANDEGVAKFDFVDKLVRLNGPNSIVGRAMVVHADPDDLGLGNIF